MLIIIILTLSTFAAVILLARTVWALQRYVYRPVKAAGSLRVPTISVCIAARNEMHALAQCLERVIKSDYPKLEVLVLDDSSNDDTSLIIKSFAHAGVRFIAGSSLPAGWLGKNHAYQALISESSGEYILFLDVDTIIDESTITKLMQQLLANEKSMVSALPRREDSYHLSALLGTMRYYWELLLGTRKSPPAASAIWMVERARLAQAGVGLENYSMSVRPERHLARQLQASKDYYYLISGKGLGIGFEKRLGSQYETALRLYYPMSGRTFVFWILSSLFLLLLVVPISVLIAPFSSVIYTAWASVVTLIVAVAFALYTLRTYGGTLRLLRIILGPLLVIQELILLIASQLKYRLGTVTWKGRSINAQPSKHDAISLNE